MKNKLLPIILIIISINCFGQPYYFGKNYFADSGMYDKSKSDLNVKKHPVIIGDYKTDLFVFNTTGYFELGRVDKNGNFFAPGDTIITGLNLRSSVVKTFISLLDLKDPKQLSVYNKAHPTYIDGSIPTDNQNVLIDTMYTDVAVYIYQQLGGNVYTVTAFENYKTDITSKRATNTILGPACDAIDTSIVNQVAILPTKGLALLTTK